MSRKLMKRWAEVVFTAIYVSFLAYLLAEIISG